MQVAPALIYIALVFVGGSIVTPDLPADAPPLPDKLAHFLAFGGLQILMFRAVRFIRPLSGFSAQNLIAVALSSGAGALLEFWQAALPHRSAELADWLADTAGALLGATLLAVVSRSFAPVEAANSEPGEGRS